MFRLDRLLPVPLIDVERVEVIQVFVATDGIHVCVETVAGRDAVSTQFHAFPLGQRMNHLCITVAHATDGKFDSTFHTIQIIIDAGSGEDEQRGCHTAEAQRLRQFLLKAVFQ